MASLKASAALISARIVTAALVLMLAAGASAQPTDLSVEAAFLPRFVRYVTWSAAAMPKGGDPFILCVVGSDPFGSQIDEAARSQLIDGRRIVVRRLDSASGIEGCHVAFVGGERAGQLVASIGRRPVLTVTDGTSSTPRGIINFVIVGGRVRFYIDQILAAQRGIQISSRLLALAIGVKQ